MLQAEKIDPELKCVKKWITGLDTKDYPAPIVDHQFARERVLKTYRRALAIS